MDSNQLLLDKLDHLADLIERMENKSLGFDEHKRRFIIHAEEACQRVKKLRKDQNCDRLDRMRELKYRIGNASLKSDADFEAVQKAVIQEMYGFNFLYWQLTCARNISISPLSVVHR